MAYVTGNTASCPAESIKKRLQDDNEPDHFSPPVSVLNYCYIYNRRSNTRRDSTMNVFGLLVRTALYSMPV